MGRPALGVETRIAETSVLGSCMLDSEQIPRCAALVTAEMFATPKHGMLWTVILQLHAERKPADILLMLNKLEEQGKVEEVGGAEYLAHLLDAVPSASNAVHYAQIMATQARRRHLALLCEKALDDNRKQRNPHGIAGRLVDEIEHIIAAGQPDSGAQTIGALLADWDVAQGVELVSLGVPELDRALGGGVQWGDSVIIGAESSIGKTALLLQIALSQALRGQRVAVISCEQSAEQIRLRLLSSHARIDNVLLRRGLPPDFIEAAKKAKAELAVLPLVIVDAPGLQAGAFRHLAEGVIRNHQVKVVGLDYIQLLAAGGDLRREVSAISLDLKTIARENRIITIGISQLSRVPIEFQRKAPTLTRLKESGEIENNADVVILPYFPSERNERGDGIMRLRVGKNRSGPVGYVDMAWVGRYTRLEVLADETEIDAEGVARREDAHRRAPGGGASKSKVLGVADGPSGKEDQRTAIAGREDEAQKHFDADIPFS